MPITEQRLLQILPNAAAAPARAEQDKRLAIEQQLAMQDEQHTKELFDAQRNQARLRDSLATADVRLSVLIEDSASGCNLPTPPRHHRRGSCSPSSPT